MDQCFIHKYFRISRVSQGWFWFWNIHLVIYSWFNKNWVHYEADLSYNQEDCSKYEFNIIIHWYYSHAFAWFCTWIGNPEVTEISKVWLSLIFHSSTAIKDNISSEPENFICWFQGFSKKLTFFTESCFSSQMKNRPFVCSRNKEISFRVCKSR